jgi:hypothetical protein
MKSLLESKQGLRGAMGPVVTVGVLLLLVAITIFNFMYRPPSYSVDLISNDIAQLQAIFKKIDERCKILGFDYQKNPINFLNVGSFKSSELGPMNLTYPAQWQGPYVDDNPSFQGVEYQIVKTKKGYFITPGEGVQLPNGKVIGKDIILDEHADVSALMKDKDGLMYDDKALAAPLELSIRGWQKMLLENVFSEDEADLVHGERAERVGVQLAAK